MLEKNPEIVVREEAEGHALLFNPTSSRSLVLNRTALFIWQLCDGRRSPQEIEDAVTRRFDFAPGGVTVDALHHAVQDHLRILTRASLIRESGEAAAPGGGA